MPDPVTGVIAGTGLVSGYMGSKAAKDAANIQAGAADRAAAQEMAMFEQQREDLAPYRELGYTSLGEIEKRLPYFTSEFSGDQLAKYLDPATAFQMKYGTQATERLGNVGGGALSGNTLRRLTEFGQELGSTAYQGAFNRFQTERGNIYNTLANIAGMGQGAVNTGVQASQNLAGNLTGLTTGSAAAQAAGQVGAANAYSSALQGPSNYMQLSALMGRSPFGVAQPGGSAGMTGGWANPYAASAGANFTAPQTYG